MATYLDELILPNGFVDTCLLCGSKYKLYKQSSALLEQNIYTYGCGCEIHINYDNNDDGHVYIISRCRYNFDIGI